MKTFESFNFAAPIPENLKRHGFETPTPIQAGAIPAVLEGRDVVGLAATGTGKTAAFVLPILHKLSSGPRRYVRALIIGPTRELAEQINEVVHQLGRGTQLHTALIYGGISYRPQFDAIRRGAEIVVACPGRLLDHLRQGTIKLDRVDMLVLDEADQMFDMGFLPSIKEIIRRVSTQRQTMLFSATMPPEIRKLAQHILRDPVEVKLAHSAPVETVSHAIFPVKQENKTALLIELLRRTDAGPVLIFTRTRHRTKKLADQLVKSGFRAASIQGDLSQNKRKQAMDGFRNGQFQILVATDVAARGIDVSGISHVINFDIPDTVDAYTHRIGRTGRATKTGDAFTLVTREDADTVRQIERVLRAPIERRFLDGFDNKGEPQDREQAGNRGQAGHGAPRHRDERPGRGPQRGGHSDRPRHEGASHRPQHGGHARPPQHAPRRESPAHAPAESIGHAVEPRRDQPPFQHREPPFREARHDDRRSQRPVESPRRDEAPREGQPPQTAFKKPFPGPRFEKKSYGSKFENRPSGPGFAKKSDESYRKPAGNHRKSHPGDEPTMTGAPPHQGSSKTKRPFWERFSRH